MRPCARPTPASAVASSSRPNAPALRVPGRPAASCPRPAAAAACAMAWRSWPPTSSASIAVEVPPAEQWVDVAPGIEVGRVWRGLDRVAAYVPGGTAAYPSSLLMSAIPARLAGVGRYVVASPAAADGQLSPALLGAAGLMEVDEFWVMGGAQAVGALAYGTESIRARRQDRGPRQRLGHGGQAGGAGPLRHRHAGRPHRGHGRGRRHGRPGPRGRRPAQPGRARGRLPCPAGDHLGGPGRRGGGRAGPPAADAPAPRDAGRRRWPRPGTVVLTADVAEALAFADEYAPEHLSCVVADLDAALGIPAARRLPVPGAYAPESAGDYAAGSNHVLPTAGAGRAYSPLGVESFGRWMQVNRITRDGLASHHPGRGGRGRGGGPHGAPPRGRDPLRGRALMSLPVTEAIAAASNVYTWEPPDRVIAARYGLAPADILRFDTNTSPTAPDFVAEALAASWDPGLNEYPDSTYADLAEAAAAYVGADPSEILVGCGADEVLDIIAKTFLAPGSGSLVPTPTYGMYARARLAARRAAAARAAPGASRWLRPRPARRPLAPSRGRRRLAVCPQQPHRGTRVARRPSRPSWKPARACPDGGPAIVVDEAYIEFHPGSTGRMARALPGPHRRAHAVQGLRPAGPAGGLRRRLAPHHRAPGARAPAGQRLHGLGHRRRGRAAPPGAGDRQRRGAGSRARLAGGRSGSHRPAGLPERHQLPARTPRGPRGRRGSDGAPAPARHRAAHLRGGPPAARSPALHGA